MSEPAPSAHDTTCSGKEPVAITDERTLDRKIGLIPPSGLGPDGKLRLESEEERRLRLESARRRLREIAEVPNEPDDPPDEEWMRAIDELRPHRPVFKGSY
jgi:hypothetical protein